MRLAAALAVAAAALALPAANAADQQRVLGIDTTILGMRLAWYDPATLTKLPGRTVSLANHDGAWSLSSDGRQLAVASRGGADLRFIDVGRMRVGGALRLGTKASPAVVTWPRVHRLLAAGGGSVTAVDTNRLRIVRRTSLPAIWGSASLRNGIALLLGPRVDEGFATAVVGVVDGDGRLRRVALDRITLGSRSSGDVSEVRQPGFAVDSVARRAFVVGADYTIAEIDLTSLAVSYHGGSTRSLTKEQPGPVRTARWLGNGLLAVSGIDGVTRDGLRVVNTNTWSTRIGAVLLSARVRGVWIRRCRALPLRARERARPARSRTVRLCVSRHFAGAHRRPDDRNDVAAGAICAASRVRDAALRAKLNRVARP